MSDELGEFDPEGSDSNPYDGWAVVSAFRIRTALFWTTLAYAVYAFFWDAGWLPFWALAATLVGLSCALYMPILKLQIRGLRLRRSVKKREAQIADLQSEGVQLRILRCQQEAEIAQKEAQLSALRRENLEMERLMLQRRVEQEAREARQRLEIACAAIEADHLEAAAWRMELSVKQLELKLGQADLFESLSAIEDNAQDRILAAYEQGIDHGKRGIVIPPKFLRHLRVVEESA